jgi:hypothetical protein
VAFYPPEIPDDWQLAYYANEFRALVLPFEMFRDSSKEEIRRWRDAVRPDFRFALELRPYPRVHELAAKSAPLAGRIAGILVRGAGEAFAESCSRSFAPLPLSVEAPAGQLIDPTLLDRVGAALYWPTPGTSTCRADCAMGRLSLTSDLRALRTQIEDFLGYASGCSQALLVVEGDGLNVELMRRARLIGELLGH